MMIYRSTAMMAATVFAAGPLLAQQAIQDADIISLAEWQYEDLYEHGVSAQSMMDRSVFGQAGEEIGEVEDILIGADGNVLSLVAEVGGLWDIGDTHVSIPIDQVEMTAEGVVVPITEETVDDYDFWQDDDQALTAETAESEVVEGVDDAAAARAWRASEMIGDYARVREDDTYSDYGYISDLILRDGEVEAVVVQPRRGYGAGYRAFPYYGPGYGWTAGAPYYDMPYRADDVETMEDLDYDRLDN